ncbi:MAG: DUF2314 domain-containing protein [Pseudomonadota bacterium]
MTARPKPFLPKLILLAALPLTLAACGSAGSVEEATSDTELFAEMDQDALLTQASLPIEAETDDLSDEDYAFVPPADLDTGPDRVLDVPSEMEGMAAAVELAQAELETFEDAMERGDSAAGYAVKFDLTGGDETKSPEYIWGQVSDLTEEGYMVVLQNQPMAEGYAYGDLVEARADDIVDFAYEEDGVPQGHYTTSVILKMMPADEAAAYREEMGL